MFFRPTLAPERSAGEGLLHCQGDPSPALPVSYAWIFETVSGSGFDPDAMYNRLVQTRRILLVLVMLMMLSACRWIPWLKVPPTPTPTLTATATRPAKPTPTDTPTPEFLPMCTPPLCAIGTNEVYYCSETCPNGCGTTCATYTPTPY